MTNDTCLWNSTVVRLHSVTQVVITLGTIVLTIIDTGLPTPERWKSVQAIDN